MDLRFVEKFTKSGGHFLYCENDEDLNSNVRKIAVEENIDLFFTSEKDIEKLLTDLELKSSSDVAECNAIISSCEALIASHDHLNEKNFTSSDIDDFYHCSVKIESPILPIYFAYFNFV